MKEGEKYCLAFHPSKVFQDLQEMGGVSLKDLNEHANAVGGCWGNDSWAHLVRDDVEIDFEILILRLGMVLTTPCLKGLF